MRIEPTPIRSDPPTQPILSTLDPLLGGDTKATALPITQTDGKIAAELADATALHDALTEPSRSVTLPTRQLSPMLSGIVRIGAMLTSWVQRTFSLAPSLTPTSESIDPLSRPADSQSRNDELRRKDREIRRLERDDIVQERTTAHSPVDGQIDLTITQLRTADGKTTDVQQIKLADAARAPDERADSTAASRRGS